MIEINWRAARCQPATRKNRCRQSITCLACIADLRGHFSFADQSGPDECLTPDALRHGLGKNNCAAGGTLPVRKFDAGRGLYGA